MKNCFTTLILFFSLCGVSQARVVALLYDDSGSMADKQRLANFSAQLLTSTLDGRENEDKYFTAKMDDFTKIAKEKNFEITLDDIKNSVKPSNISNEAQIQNRINEIRTEWLAVGQNTPHHQITGLIDRIVENQTSGEEAYLIILTDGEMSEIDINQFRDLMELYKERLKGPLRVDYLLVGPDSLTSTKDDAVDRTVGDAVEEQGIRKVLFEVLNGNANIGRTDIYNSDDMFQAIKDIIARIGGTKASSLERYVNRSGNKVTVDAPLAIKRLVSVSLSRLGGTTESPAASPTSYSFDESDRLSLFSNMSDKDTKIGWENVLLNSETTHFLFENPLPAGLHTIEYDSSPDDLFLLFQSAVELELLVVDETGNELAKNSSGEYEVIAGSVASVQARIIDESANGKVLVNPSNLDGLDLTASIEKNNDSKETDFTVNNEIATISLDTLQPSAMSISASMNLDGFVSASAKPIVVNVIDVDVEIDLDVRPSHSCNNCGDNQIAVPVEHNNNSYDIGELIISSTSPLTGSMSIRIEDQDGGFKVESGSSRLNNLTLTEGSDSTVLKLTQNGAPLSLLQRVGSKSRIRIIVEANGQLLGSSTKDIELLFQEPAGRILYAGSSQGDADSGVLSMDMDMLDQNTEFINIELHDAIYPASPDGAADLVENLSIDLNHPFLKVNSIQIENGSVDTDGIHEIDVAIEKRLFCGCLIYFFGQGEYSMSVDWVSTSGRHSSSSKAPYVISVPFRNQGLIECIKFFGFFLLLIYLFIALVKRLRAHQFPGRSGFDVSYNKADPIYRSLHKFNWTTLKALFWWIFNIPHEKRVVEGLHVEARKSGAMVNLRKSPKNAEIESVGSTIEEILEINPKAETQIIGWGDSVNISYKGSKTRMQLLKSVSDRQA